MKQNALSLLLQNILDECCLQVSVDGLITKLELLRENYALISDSLWNPIEAASGEMNCLWRVFTNSQFGLDRCLIKVIKKIKHEVLFALIFKHSWDGHKCNILVQILTHILRKFCGGHSLSCAMSCPSKIQ